MAVMKMFCIQSARMPSIQDVLHAISIHHKICVSSKIDDGKICTRSSSVACDFDIQTSANEMEQVVFVVRMLIDVQMWCTYLRRRIWSKQGRNWTIFGCFFFFLSFSLYFLLARRLSCIIIIYNALYAFSALVVCLTPDVCFLFCSLCIVKILANDIKRNVRAHKTPSHSHDKELPLILLLWRVRRLRTAILIEFMIFDALVDFRSWTPLHKYSTMNQFVSFKTWMKTINVSQINCILTLEREIERRKRWWWWKKSPVNLHRNATE